MRLLIRAVTYFSDSFILAPLLYSLFNVILACSLSLIRSTDDDPLLVERARHMADTVSSAAITIVTLSFSLTVLSVQIAAQSYSPRLLDDFLKDRVAKVAIAVNFGAFLYCYTLLYFLYDSPSDGVPKLAIHFISVHCVLVFAEFVGFIHYFINGFRLESILSRAAVSSWRAAKALSLVYQETAEDQPLNVPSNAYKVLADGSGYVARYQLEQIVPRMKSLDLCCLFHPHVGEYVSEGTLIAYVWDAETDDLKESIADKLNAKNAKDGDVEEKLGKIVSKGIRLSQNRAGQYDVTLGIQQLSDIATRALSAAINDPMTAIQAMDMLTELFTRLATLDFKSPCVRDASGVVRLSAPRRSFSYLLSLSDSIRHYGGSDLAVCRRGMRMLGDIGVVLKRHGRMKDFPAVLAQLEQWMITSKKHFEPDSPELKSVEEVYGHVVDLLATYDRPTLVRGESTETNPQELDVTFEEPTPAFLESMPKGVLSQSDPNIEND